MSEGGDEVIDPAEIDDLLKSANLGTPPHAGAVPPGVGPAIASPASPQPPQAAATQAPTATATAPPPRAARDLTAGEEISTSEIEAMFKAHVPPAPARAAAPPAPARGAAPRPEARSVESNLRRVEDGVRAALAGSSNPASRVQPQDARPFEFEQFDLSGLSPAQVANISTVRDVELDLRIELGRAELLIDEVLKLREGSVVPLDKLAGDPVDILVNGRLVARGEVLVLNDNFCVRVAEILISAG